MFDPCQWPTSSSLLVGRTAGRGCFQVGTTGCRLRYQAATYASYGSQYPFLTSIPDGADNNYCLINTNSYTNYGTQEGFACRTAFSQTTLSENIENIEIYAH